MTTYEQTVSKMRQLPDSLIQEVDDFIDFLLSKWRGEKSPPPGLRAESLRVAESDMANYRANLEDYEARLERGEVQW